MNWLNKYLLSPCCVAGKIKTLIQHSIALNNNGNNSYFTEGTSDSVLKTVYR